MGYVNNIVLCYGIAVERKDLLQLLKESKCLEKYECLEEFLEDMFENSIRPYYDCYESNPIYVLGVQIAGSDSYDPMIETEETRENLPYACYSSIDQVSKDLASAKTEWNTDLEQLSLKLPSEIYDLLTKRVPRLCMMKFGN